MSYCKSPFARPKVTTDPAALSWRQWLPMVDGAFAVAFVLGFKRGLLLQDGYIRLSALPLRPCIHPCSLLEMFE